MPEEKPSKRLERWSSLAADAMRELDLYETKLERLTDERARKDVMLQNLLSAAQALLDEAAVESKWVSEAVLAAKQVPADSEDVSDLNEIQKHVDRLQSLMATASDANKQYDIAWREYQRLSDESEKWLEHTPEPVEQLLGELTSTRASMGHVLYALSLGRVASSKHARSHILRFAVRHPGASVADICTYLDSKNVPLPTKKWNETVRRKYGYPFWKYSLNGDNENAINADKRLAHRTTQYVWRYLQMGNDLRALYKIKTSLKLRKLRLPGIEPGPNPPTRS